MKPAARLSPDDRKFFAQVGQAIFTNPFGDERAEIIGQLAPGKTVSPENRAHPLKVILPVLTERIDRLKRKKITALRDLRGEDLSLVKYPLLLQVYLQYSPQIDDLIQRQLTAGARPVVAPFGEELLGQLAQRGFSDDEGLRYFALFYQLRRAYYFIDQALIGDCPSMKNLRRALWNNIFTHDVRIYDQHLWNRMEDFSTLLLGETGAGKGSAAAAIGRSGYLPFDRGKKRFAQSFTETFIPINLSQFPESLIESELFGHRKGAFTGAIENHVGLFERCSAQGALFLDEIGEVSVPIQIKLLQVLQERTYTPVGSHTPNRFSGRVIAATNRSLRDLRAKGSLRDDFFYRLCSDVITVPPLRQRIRESPAELEQLVDLLIERMTGQGSSKLRGLILEILRRDLPGDYPWPGNVRELEQAVRRILLNQKCEGTWREAGADPESRLLDRLRDGSLEVRELMALYCEILYRKYGTYEEVGRRAGLDRRTVKKYLSGKNGGLPEEPPVRKNGPETPASRRRG